jgi:spore coat-associated protein N
VRLTLLAAAVLAVLTLVQDGGERCGPGVPRLQLVDGSLSLKNSLDGQAVFSADDMAPGESAAGTVNVSNAGSMAGDLTLAGGEPLDTPGEGGGLLSERLGLVVRDVTSGVTVYSGPLLGLGALRLGRLGPGAARAYSFTASLPADAGDSVEGASTVIAYRWTVEAAAASAPAWTPPAPDTRPLAVPHGPHLALRVPRRQRSLSRRRLVAFARCLEPCRLVARARVPAGRGRRALTRPVRTRPLRAGRRARLVLRIPRRARRTVARLLRKRGRLAVTITVTGTTPEGARRTFTKRARRAGR